MMKMNTLLAKVEHSTASFNRIIADYYIFFSKKQGMFEGIKKTFKPREGYQEDASKMGTTKVATTVGEKLEWFEENAIPHLKDVFAIESTNSKGANKVELKVGDISFGFLYSISISLLNVFSQTKGYHQGF